MVSVWFHGFTRFSFWKSVYASCYLHMATYPVYHNLLHMSTFTGSTCFTFLSLLVLSIFLTIAFSKHLVVCRFPAIWTVDQMILLYILMPDILKSVQDCNMFYGVIISISFFFHSSLVSQFSSISVVIH